MRRIMLGIFAFCAALGTLRATPACISEPVWATNSTVLTCGGLILTSFQLIADEAAGEPPSIPAMEAMAFWEADWPSDPDFIRGAPMEGNDCRGTSPASEVHVASEVSVERGGELFSFAEAYRSLGVAEPATAGAIGLGMLVAGWGYSKMRRARRALKK